MFKKILGIITVSALLIAPNIASAGFSGGARSSSVSSSHSSSSVSRPSTSSSPSSTSSPTYKSSSSGFSGGASNIKPSTTTTTPTGTSGISKPTTVIGANPSSSYSTQPSTNRSNLLYGAGGFGLGMMTGSMLHPFGAGYTTVATTGGGYAMVPYQPTLLGTILSILLDLIVIAIIILTVLYVIRKVKGRN